MPLMVVPFTARFGPRLGPYAGLADVPSAMSFALCEVGSPPADPFNVLNSDLAVVVPDDYNRLEDLTLLRCYETILVNCNEDMFREAGIREKPADVRKMFLELLKQLRTKIKDQYGIGLPTPSAGVISLDFASQGSDRLYPTDYNT